MATQYTERPLEAEAWRGGKAIYPWTDWLNGQWWSAERHLDFQPTAQSFRAQVNMAANRKGMKIESRILGDVVYWRSYPKDTVEEQ